jgi:hypothetical protein
VTGKPSVQTMVLFPRLLRKAKEREDDEGAQDDYPSGQLVPDKSSGVVLPYDARVLRNMGIVLAEFSPIPFRYAPPGSERNIIRP